MAISLLIFWVEGKGNQSWPAFANLDPELPCDAISQRRCADLRYRQATGRDHQGRRMKFASFSLDDKSVAVLNVQWHRVYENLNSGSLTFGFQHPHDVLRRPIAEELTKFLLVVRNLVLLD